MTEHAEPHSPAAVLTARAAPARLRRSQTCLFSDPAAGPPRLRGTPI
jgi:hypothetical protein